MKQEDFRVNNLYKFYTGHDVIKYVGKNGEWFQFTLAKDRSGRIWCELLDSDLKLIHEYSAIKRPIKLMVIGYARHGKDTVCDLLPLKYESSSVMAAKIFIFELLKGKYGYATFEECFNDRVNHRAEWHQLIKDYNKDDKTRLAQDIYAENDIYCGIRDKEEFFQAKGEKLFDLSIWVDASDRLPPEPSSSISLKKHHADIVIDNNGTLDSLKDKVERLWNVIG